MLKPMHIKGSRLSHTTTKKLLDFFISGTTARTASKLSHVNRNTAIKFYQKLRKIIEYNLSKTSPFFAGEIEVDESYFGGTRKGKRGRGAADKVPVFGLLKRNGKVYTQIIPDAKSETLIPIIRSKIKPDSIVYTDYWRAYDVLDVSEFKHKRVNHSKEFVDRENHINGIENFWNQAKRHMRKFNGIPKENFNLFLKECEFRFNFGDSKNQLKTLKKWIKMYNKFGLN